jgi:ZIP family zinc transporter
VEVVLFSLGAVCSTLAGGLFGLRHKRHLHRILGFTAGVLLGVVAFDVLPEIFDLVDSTGIDPVYPMLALVTGFLGIHVLEKTVLLHSGHEDDYVSHTHPRVGMISALALIGHSLADGIAIGLAFQAGNAVGLAVAVAVIAHDFSDGLNTVSLMLAHRNTDRRSFVFMLIGAAAPLAGALSTLLFSVPDDVLLIYLGGFAGFLLYIGASDILPQAHSARPSAFTMLLTTSGAALMLLVTQVAHV